MDINFNLTMEQVQKLTMTPELIQAIRILQFNSHELEDYAQEEMIQNPLLEYEELQLKPWEYSLKPQAPEAVPFERYVTIEETLQDSLLLQLTFSNLKGKELKIGRYLVEAIDDNGYLSVPVEEAAKLFEVSNQEIEKVVDVIQTFDPAGVGARDLKECLIIQLARKGFLDDAIEYILLNHLDDLGEGRLGKIAKSTGLNLIEVQTVADLIRTLNPRPGNQFSTKDEIKYIIPDVTAEFVNDRFVVNTNESSIPHLMLSPYYYDLARSSADDKEVVQYLNRKYNSAIWLIKSIEQRKTTIRKVAEAVVNWQMDFFIKGPKFMKTLTLKDIADQVGIHESTVSRSINDKYVETPKGIYELKYFFSSGVSGSDGEMLSSNSIKTFIREIISQEDAKNPYSDQAMVEILSEKGIEISRRTVAKYRESMGVLSSAKRKRY